MHKLFFSFVALFLTQYLLAEDELITNVIYMTNDVEDNKVPEGYCLLVGRVYIGYSDMSVNEATVSNYGTTAFTQTDKLGKFKLLIPAVDSVIYMHHPQHGEIISEPYNFKSGHVVTVEIVTDLPNTYYDDMMPVAEKPIIYFYNDTPLNVSVTLKPKGELTFTYPEYNKKWDATVTPNGLEVNDKAYPYLFWEAEIELDFVSTQTSMEGYFIRTDTVISFLENELTVLGLNAIEKADFITYWGPRLQKHDYATVQFFTDEVYTEYIAELKITPQPDHIRRVYMMMQGTAIPVCRYQLTKPTVELFERGGFTVLEWGGSELQQRYPVN